MTDREMLELAAKAGGIGLWHEDVFTNGLTRKVNSNGVLRWNPLTDGGDALRLAVDLQIALHHFRDSCAAASGARFYTELHNGDPQAAACRAITRTAAEIGKVMP